MNKIFAIVATIVFSLSTVTAQAKGSDNAVCEAVSLYASTLMALRQTGVSTTKEMKDKYGDYVMNLSAELDKRDMNEDKKARMQLILIASAAQAYQDYGQEVLAAPIATDKNKKIQAIEEYKVKVTKECLENLDKKEVGKEKSK